MILDEGPQRLIGPDLEYDLDTRTGQVTEATAYVENEYYFTGARSQDRRRHLHRRRRRASPPAARSPDVEHPLSHAEVTLDEYARIKNARLKFKKLPVLYVALHACGRPTPSAPRACWCPSRATRAARRRELAWPTSRPSGAAPTRPSSSTCRPKEYFGFGNETRYRPSETPTDVQGLRSSRARDAATSSTTSLVFDPTPGDDRWKLEWRTQHRTSGAASAASSNLNLYSDFDYLQDIERNVQPDAGRSSTPTPS